MFRTGTIRCTLGSAFLLLGSALASAQCVMDWQPGFEPRGVAGSSYFTSVHALATFDDGHGPALYVGGSFEVAGTAVSRNIAKWDGETWSGLGSGLIYNGTVRALIVFDDGGGPALYAGGEAGVQKWDGTSWTYIGGGDVYGLAVFDDGSGPALYAAAYGHVTKWDGRGWSIVGSFYHYDFNPEVYCLGIYDDGSGPALYAGGHFTKANGVPAYYIARWDGTTWSAVGDGIGGVGWGMGVLALHVYDDGGGPALYAAGDFLYAGSAEANGIGKWDGTDWSDLAGGLGPSSYYPEAYALAVYDAGNGPVLCVGGDFETAGGVPAPVLATWDGVEWAALGAGPDGVVLALAAADDEGAPVLYAGGYFTSAAGLGAQRIAKWDAYNWSALGTGQGASDTVGALLVFDDGSGPALYAGGGFTAIGGTPALGVARWDGARWWGLGEGLLSASVDALASFDDGAGAALYVGGAFPRSGWVELNNIGKWDGSQWCALGSGTNDVVASFAVFDDGTGSALYVSGTFTTAGGVPANYIARWDGQTWSSVGGGVAGYNAWVAPMLVFDDGTGAALFVAGHFTSAGGVPANSIARWDGQNWSALGSGLQGYTGAYRMTIFDDGAGAALYVAGGFTLAGGLHVNNIAKWNGQAWSGLGAGADGQVTGLAVFDDGTGPRLVAGGWFEWAGGVPARHLATWDGTVWRPLGGGTGGIDGGVGGFAVVQSPGPSLYLAGGFIEAGAIAAGFVGQWRCVALRGDLNCDGAVNEFDIDPFVVALVAAELYKQQFPDCDIRSADCNADDLIDAFDIDPFVTLLTNP